MKQGSYEYTENRPTESHWGLGDLIRGAEGSAGPTVAPDDWKNFKDALAKVDRAA